MAVPLLFLDHLLCKTSPSSSLLFLIKPLSIKTTTNLHFRKPITTILNPSPNLPHLFCNSLSSSSSSLSPSLLEPISDLDPEIDSEGENIEPHLPKSTVKASTGSVNSNELAEKLPLPDLTVKEKKELAAYAHSLGKKLKCQLVGKSGVTLNVAASFVENLESNELLKVKVHNNCPGELDDVVKELEKTTGSVAVGHIGRTLILYRPSLTKLKAEEKKNQHRRIFRPKLTEQKKVHVLKISGRGRRGSSRFVDNRVEQRSFEN